ncbi:hypothetical protein [Micromonospora orduensis]|uniref:hypothetical protein n=1 Tax=Micromonospora orduensis TaxID=1420891 RepID=UPI001FCBDE61|nr:hypothetical protein [Micromonospora orduensis]
MDAHLQSLLDRSGGLATRLDVLRVAPPWALQAACRAGGLVRVLPGVYVDTSLARDTPSELPVLARLEPELARRAALSFVLPRGSGLRSRPHLVVRHRSGFAVAPPQVVVRGGLPVTRLDRTLVDCWPLLPTVDRPELLIRAVNDRLTTPQRLVAALGEVPRLTGRTAMRDLLDRLAAGCRSPLEIWGHDHVFTGPGMPPFLRQARVRVGGRPARHRRHPRGPLQSPSPHR